MRDDASAISKQDKGKGTNPIPTYFHHPATAGWDGESTTFAVTKVWFLSFCVRGQFCESGPYPEPTIFAWKMGKISPPVKNWVSCEKAGGLKPADLLWELEDLAGNRSGIRSCGLLFCWASLGDPASFIPLNRNFQQIGRFSITEWVRALPVLRLMASRARCLPLPKEEFIEEETAFATHATHATQKSASLFLRDLRCVRDGRCILHRHDLAAVYFPAGESNPQIR